MNLPETNNTNTTMKQATVTHTLPSKKTESTFVFTNGKLDLIYILNSRHKSITASQFTASSLESLLAIYAEAREIERQGVKAEVPEGYTTEPLPSRFEDDAAASES